MGNGAAPAARIGPGLWSIPVPIPDNPLGFTLVYLLESTAGPVLVDAGWDHPASWRALTDGVRSAGAAITDVYGVLVTHHHPDHVGLAPRVRAESGAWIALHPEDAAVLRRQRDEEPADGGRRLDRMLTVLRAAGAPPDEIAALRARDGWRPREPAAPDRELADGQLADVPGRRVRALWTPGHSPGHTCFYLEGERRLLSGDHLLPSITPHIALFDGEPGDPLADFLGSLGKLAALDVDEVLPAHEYRFTGAGQRAEEIAAHHHDRLREVVAALSPATPTLWEITRRMRWNQPWEEMTVMSHRMALAEAAAHLRYLQRRDRVRVTGDGWPVRYERVPDPSGQP